MNDATALPPGIHIEAGGLITGSTTTRGTFPVPVPVPVSVCDSAEACATLQITLICRKRTTTNRPHHR
ncbi:hypothetical protein SAMN05421505_13255 [Sinosporangium album]|uniref:Uncharacterized protein n=1 Tax=Sinosporangium album TaxID=504805 RepID=A0A1G8HJ22_9ACTN|nr:hypothetical protein [Sinosporangium album]SDI06676.1 hypothetical protein SAMN05421505_13255 [Sinosporangium album]